MSKLKGVPNAALAVCALLAAAFVSVILVKFGSPPEPFLSTSSPGGAYTVSLTGQKGRPNITSVYSNVYFSARRNADEFLSGRRLHSGDWFDLSFDVAYPDLKWVSENFLLFYREKNFTEGTPGKLIVVNDTDKKINYIRVTADCMLLLFDVQPGSRAETPVPAPRGSLKWISVEGEYSNGRSIGKGGADFIVGKDSHGPFTYEIRINKVGPSIESPELKKYTSSE